jgi:RimJ/RimL family protein N-acetyltransferase
MNQKTGDIGYRLPINTNATNAIQRAQRADIICIEGHYKKSDGGCFWVAESIENYDNRNNHQIIGTIAIRNLKQFESTAELKRMYISRQFRQLGIGQDAGYCNRLC